MLDKTLTQDSGAIARAFETAASNAFESIMVTQEDSNRGGHRIVFVNNAFTQMTGFTQDDVIGRTPGILQGAKTDPHVINDLRVNLENGRDFHGKTINYRKDGSEFMIEWKVFPVRDNKGDVTHHVAIQRETA